MKAEKANTADKFSMGDDFSVGDKFPVAEKSPLGDKSPAADNSSDANRSSVVDSSSAIHDSSFAGDLSSASKSGARTYCVAESSNSHSSAHSVVCERFDNLGFEDSGQRYRLGIMGGTFDPIHIGHLACAEQVRETFSLDGVVFIPAGDPWMKEGRGVSAAEDRFAMVSLAVADNPSFDASRLEIDRPGKTYTVDTLRALRSYYPSNVELYFISGADAVFRILEWRNAQEVTQLARLIAVTRPGYEISDARRKYMRTHASILHLWQAEVTGLDISSTDLRKKIAEGKSVRYLVPQVVADYINKHGLYR